jgi:hypothetical protein
VREREREKERDRDHWRKWGGKKGKTEEGERERGRERERTEREGEEREDVAGYGNWVTHTRLCENIKGHHHPGVVTSTFSYETKCDHYTSH